MVAQSPGGLGGIEGSVTSASGGKEQAGGEEGERLLVYASAFWRLIDPSSGRCLVCMNQAAVIGKGVGRRVVAVGATADGRVAVSGSNNGMLVC